MRLRGPRGSLDIFAVYASAVSYAQRRTTFGKLREALRPRHDVLSVVLVDMNYVERTYDRYNIFHGSFSGTVDASEAKDVRDVVRDSNGFSCYDMPSVTERRAASAAKLDRIYANH